MKRYYLKRLTVLWTLFLIGCVSPYEPTGLENTAGMLVVEGMILETGNSFVKLSRTNAIDAEKEPYDKINDAQVSLLCRNGQTLPFYLSDEDGVYKPKDILSYDMAETYAVDVKIGNKHYQSEYQTPIRTPEIEDVNYATKEDGTQVNIRVSTKDPNGNIFYYRWDCEEDWEYSAKYYAYEYWDPATKRFVQFTGNDTTFYYCWDHRIALKFALGAAHDRTSAAFVNHTVLELPYEYRGTRFTVLYSVLVKQYAIDKKAYTYYDQLKKHIEDMGSIFAPQPTELKGNIFCLSDPAETVVGYVIVTSETTQRLYINAKEVPEMYPDYACGDELLVGDGEAKTAYDSGFGVLYESEPGLHAWITRRCVDCRESGGTKYKPEWWPTDHK